MKILIVSDIHANWPALSAVVASEPYDRLICLGDLVDYGPHPRPCLEYIRQHADWVIRGNHDNALGFDVDCGCRGDFRELSVSTRAWHRTLVHEDDLAFLRNLPRTIWLFYATSHCTKRSRWMDTASTWDMRHRMMICLRI